MKADDCHSPSRSYALGQNLKQSLQLAQFIIDRDAERLKYSRGRVDGGATSIARAGWTRHTTPHQLGQLLGGLQRLAVTHLNDPSRDPPTEALLAVVVDQVREVAFAQPPQERTGRLTCGRIETHVQRTRLREAQA